LFLWICLKEWIFCMYFMVSPEYLYVFHGVTWVFVYISWCHVLEYFILLKEFDMAARLHFFWMCMSWKSCMLRDVWLKIKCNKLLLFQWFPDARLSEPLCSQTIIIEWIAWITVAHTFMYRAPLKYSNRTYTCTQNTLIKQSFSILRLRVYTV